MRGFTPLNPKIHGSSTLWSRKLQWRLHTLKEQFNFLFCHHDDANTLPGLVWRRYCHVTSYCFPACINNNNYYNNYNNTVQHLLSLYLTHNIVSTIGINTQPFIFLLVQCLKLHYPTRHSLQYSHSVHMICFGKSVISFSLKSTGLFIRMDSTLRCHVSGTKCPLSSCRATVTSTIIQNRDRKGYNKQKKPWEVESGV